MADGRRAADDGLSDIGRGDTGLSQDGLSDTGRPPALLLASASRGRLSTLRAAGFAPVVAVSEVDEDAVLRALAAERGVADRVLGGDACSGGDSVSAGGTSVVVPDDAVPAADQVLALARAKAREVVARRGADLAAAHPGGVLVLGCDSMLEMAGAEGADGSGSTDGTGGTDGSSRRVVVGKPGTPERAAARWRAQRGTRARLHTGHWLVRLAGAGASAHDTGGEIDATRETGAVSSATVHFADVTDAEIDAYVATGEPVHVAGAFTIDGYGAQFVTGIEGDPHGVVGVSVPLLRELAADLGVRLTDLWERPPPG